MVIFFKNYLIHFKKEKKKRNRFSLVVVTVTESRLLLRWLCLSVRDVFISFVIILLPLLSLLLLFRLVLFFTVVPPLLTWTVLLCLDSWWWWKWSNSFAIKSTWQWSFFCTKRSWSHTLFQPRWLFFQMTSTKFASLVLCFSFDRFNKIVN